jgi:hypothetical protein
MLPNNCVLNALASLCEKLETDEPFQEKRKSFKSCALSIGTWLSAVTMRLIGLSLDCKWRHKQSTWELPWSVSSPRYLKLKRGRAADFR